MTVKHIALAWDKRFRGAPATGGGWSMDDERGRAGAFSRGARGGTPRKKETGAEGTARGALDSRRRSCRQPLSATAITSRKKPTAQVRQSDSVAGSTGRYYNRTRRSAVKRGNVASIRRTSPKESRKTLKLEAR